MDDIRENTGEGEERVMLYDMHAHLGFLPEGGEGEVAWVSGKSHTGATLSAPIRFLNATVTPDEYDTVHARFAQAENVRTAPGLHPWYVSAQEDIARRQAEALAARIQPAQPVGEIGLDFGPKHGNTRDAQVLAFRRVIEAAVAAGGCTLTIHSVQATETVLDILDEYHFFAAGTAIFHWFSGSSQHLHRAVSAGAYFSYNPHMLTTKRGREYARILPAQRLLTETDYPEENGTLPEPFATALTGTLERVADIRSVDAAELSALVAENSRRLWEAW